MEIWAAQLLKMSHDIRQADKGNIFTPNNMWRSDGNDGGGGAFPFQAVDRYKYFGRWHILERKKNCEGFPLSTTGAKI